MLIAEWCIAGDCGQAQPLPWLDRAAADDATGAVDLGFQFYPDPAGLDDKPAAGRGQVAEADAQAVADSASGGAAQQFAAEHRSGDAEQPGDLLGCGVCYPSALV